MHHASWLVSLFIGIASSAVVGADVVPVVAQGFKVLNHNTTVTGAIVSRESGDSNIVRLATRGDTRNILGVANGKPLNGISIVNNGVIDIVAGTPSISVVKGADGGVPISVTGASGGAWGGSGGTGGADSNIYGVAKYRELHYHTEWLIGINSW